MLGWIKSFRERRRLRGRGLFAFYDPSAGRQRYADPLQIYRRLFQDPDFDHEKHMGLAALMVEPETSHLLNKIAEAFGVDRFDGRNGWTDRELFGLLDQLIEWLESQKKSTGKPPRCSPPTGHAPSEETRSAATNCT